MLLSEGVPTASDTGISFLNLRLKYKSGPHKRTTNKIHSYVRLLLEIKAFANTPLRLAPSRTGGCRDFTDPMYLHHSE